jgi:TolB protein
MILTHTIAQIRIVLALLMFWGFLCLPFASPPLFAAETTYIPVGSAKVKKAVLAFPEVRSQNGTTKSLAKTIAETVTHDLTFMDLFKFLDDSAFIEDPSKAGITLETFQMKDWKGIGAEFLIKSSVTLAEDSQNITFEAHLYDTFGPKQVLAKRYTAPKSEVKNIAHTFANDVITSLTGLPGIFLTKIAMTCDMTGKKEIYVMNYDGSEAKQLTRHKSIAFAPAWSPDGTRIAYSLFTRHANNIKNIDLYEFNTTQNTIRLLSDRKGINSGAAYSPDGTKMAITLSYRGNPEIFLLDLATREVSQLTKSFGVDVDPAWSPDGKQIAFVSSRTGMPMVFTTTIADKKTQRLTYAGRYNATPSWAAKKNKIAFAGWIDKFFDIFLMNPDGTNIERLTKNQGNNEDPFFSPDGNFLAFSSNRTGQKNIYVMNTDGTFVKRLTFGMGNCVTPKWSNPPTPKVSDVQN